MTINILKLRNQSNRPVPRAVFLGPGLAWEIKELLGWFINTLWPCRWKRSQRLGLWRAEGANCAQGFVCCKVFSLCYFMGTANTEERIRMPRREMEKKTVRPQLWAMEKSLEGVFSETTDNMQPDNPRPRVWQMSVFSQLNPSLSKFLGCRSRGSMFMNEATTRMFLCPPPSPAPPGLFGNTRWGLGC